MPPSAPPATSASAASAASSAPDPAADAPARGARTSAEAKSILFPGDGPASSACSAGDDATRLRCLIELRYAADVEASRLAVALYDESANIAGVERDQVMEGGFRGTIRLVGEPPIGANRRHLAWALAAARDFDRFFTALAPLSRAPIRYRWRGIALRYFRSVGRTTPSAYASDWAIAYNVAGSLNRSSDEVRETLFHELFHLNDEARGWSGSALRPIYDAIVARCGTTTACLAPYAPNKTKVRGGTWYAFQPNNGDGVAEYAAELAVRYYREQRAALAHEATTERPFKCGPDEDARAWDLLIDAFFGRADATPACEGARGSPHD